MEPPPPRHTAPKDGYGPRGFPDCYYTSRVLDSTHRYVRFVKKLRALEEEHKRNDANSLQEFKDNQYNDFFKRCDRRSLINKVARRVDLCLTSYEQDLDAKRQRLVDLLTFEEKMNIRKFVEQAQAGAEALWQDKKDRLAYLLDKRQKELEEKYKDIPIAKCVHAYPCIIKMRCKEVQEVQRYQMKENQAKKMSEIELDKMWHEVALKEAEALAARMEVDAIERLRRDHDCIKHSDEQLAMRKEQRRQDQERLKQESLKLKALFEEQSRNEDAESRLREEKKQELGRERKAMIKERRETLARQEAESKLVNDVWDSLAGMGLTDEQAKLDLRRKKQMDQDICNKRMLKIKADKEQQAAEHNILMEREMQRHQDVIDTKRCEHIKWSQKTNAEVRAGLLEQIKENATARRLSTKGDEDYKVYQKQLLDQLEKLVAHKELTDAQARKVYQSQLLEQIDYNKLIRDRALLEELEQRKKCIVAAEDYQVAITKVLSRAFFSDEIHPFMKVMYKGIKMPEKCPCSKPDYCAVPLLGPKTVPGTSAEPVPGTAPKAIPGVAPKTKPDIPAASPSK